jgi:DNA-binding PadR family transcriptional regulator
LDISKLDTSFGDHLVTSIQEAPKPMKPADFHVLLVLAGGDRHGLGIAKAVDAATDGTVRLGPGTLYRSLKELAASGLIEQTAGPPGEDDPRRRFYRITEDGLRRVRGEARRLAHLVDLARANDVLPERS